MKNLVIASVLALSGASAVASPICGNFSVQVHECFALPCNPYLKLQPVGGGKVLFVVTNKGSQAEKFVDGLNKLTNTSIPVCIEGVVVRETAINASSITRVAALPRK